MTAYITGQTNEAGKPELKKYVYRGRDTRYKMHQNYIKIEVFINNKLKNPERSVGKEMTRTILVEEKF